MLQPKLGQIADSLREGIKAWKEWVRAREIACAARDEYRNALGTSKRLRNDCSDAMARLLEGDQVVRRALAVLQEPPNVYADRDSHILHWVESFTTPSNQKPH